MKRILKSKKFWVALLVPYGIIMVIGKMISEKIKRNNGDKKNKN